MIWDRGWWRWRLGRALQGHSYSAGTPTQRYGAMRSFELGRQILGTDNMLPGGSGEYEPMTQIDCPVEVNVAQRVLAAWRLIDATVVIFLRPSLGCRSWATRSSV